MREKQRQMEMRSEEACESRAPKLPLLPYYAPTKPQEQYSATPPHQRTASIPFKWEEKPGKPRARPCKVHYSPLHKSLDLPPRLLRPSKTTTTRGSLLDGLLSSHPDAGCCRPIFHSSRFIMCREVSIGCHHNSLVLSRRWAFQFQAEEKPSWKWTASKEAAAIAKPRFNFLESIYDAVKQAIPSSRRSNNGKWQH